MAGRLEAEYRYALEHRDNPGCKSLVELAALYSALQDPACLALCEAAAGEVRKVMLEEPQP